MVEKMVADKKFNGDRPISTASEDHLGFGKMAKHLALSIGRSDLSKGLVIGIEGPWGSGKSSLLQLIIQEIQADPKSKVVIHFSPWLVGSRQELLSELLGQIADAVDASGADTGKKLKEYLKRYASAARGLALLADLTGASGAATFLMKIGLTTTAKIADRASESTLLDLKGKIVDELVKLGRSYVVVIDDLDRLDPKEAVEVLRLVRSVADFPFVGYILAYDSKILSESITTAVGAQDGKSYLEKIVQVSYRVPNAQSFDLRAWLQNELNPKVLGIDLDEVTATRLSSTVHEVSSRYLKTPRDVVRLVNAFHLYWAGQQSRIDPGDLLFLQAIRLKLPDLYTWIEEYVFALSAISDWGYLNQSAPRDMGKRLIALLSSSDDARISELQFLGEYLPGVNAMGAIRNAENFKVFEGFPNDFRATFGAECRLASPSHFRLYFALSDPTGSVSDQALSAFLSLAKSSVAEASDAFSRQISLLRPQGGTMAEVLLDRILERRAVVSSEEAEALLVVFGNTLDQLARAVTPAMGYPGFLRGENWSPFSLFSRVNPDRRSVVLLKLVREAPSLAWLSGIVRSLTQDHGFGGFKGIAEPDRLLSPEEFESVRTTWLARLVSIDANQLIEVPYLLSLLYGWMQAGAKEEVIRWVAQQSRTDEGLVKILLRMRSWVGTANGPMFPIGSETLTTFWSDAEIVQERLRVIVDANGPLSNEANTLLRAIAEGKRF